MRPPATLLVLLALGLGLAAPAAGDSLGASPDLWVTINVCDTAKHPNALGIRGSMPGNHREGLMFMRFQAQFYARQDGHWHNISSGARSPLVRVGSSRHRVRESGWVFTFAGPPAGDSHVLRGVVTFEWRALGAVVRRNGKVVRAKNGKPLRARGALLDRLRRRAQSGHPDTTGADPPGYSRGICEIR